MYLEDFYWYFTLITFLYLVINKSRYSIFHLLTILCFYSGLAAYFGKIIENPYKILLVLFSILILIKYNSFKRLNNKERFLLIIFVLFSLTFLYSAWLNELSVSLTFSQYGKYVTPICLFFVLSRYKYQIIYIVRTKNLLLLLLKVQIVLSFVKLFTYGIREYTVGSLTYVGGGQATTLPILGFILYWLHKDGKFKIRDWIFILLLAFIGFMSLKRAIWFIYPAFIFLFLYFVPARKIRLTKLLYYLPLLPIVFYLGMRLNPSLNPEGKMWGSFNPEFVWNYVIQYNFGKSDPEADIELGHGRGGVTFLLWEEFTSKDGVSANDIWGYGLDEMYTTDYETFDESSYGVNNKGAVSGIFQSYIATGFLGVIMTLMLIIAVLNLIKEFRIRIVIGLLLFWDYLFYSGLILRTQALFTLLFFIIVYSNLLYLIKQYDTKRYLQTKST